MYIFLAEDDPALSVLLRDRFRLAGHQVTHAADGETACNLLFAHPDDYDLAVLDVMLPKMNGWEICKKVKSREETRAIPIIVITAKTLSADESMSYEAGADEYMSKPFDFKELLATVKRLVEEADRSHGDQS